MPSINLRLTEEEHAQLAAWAYDEHRSLQKEIIWRLFGPRLIETNRPEEVLARLVPQPAPAVLITPEGKISPSPLPRPPDLTPGATDDVTEHFKPDFKK